MSWLLETLREFFFEDLLGFLKSLVEYIWTWTITAIKQRPGAALLALFALARLFGTVIDTGSRGVFFQFGKARKVLQPGFHFLAPFVHHVRKLHIRSATINLPPQAVVTRDDLVYEVDANFVYHIEHPIAAAVEIDDVRQGCRTVASMVLLELVRRQDQSSLTDREFLDDQFHQRLQDRLRRWGVVVEQAGLQSLAPSKETTRLTQLRVRCQETRRLYHLLRAEEGAWETSLADRIALPLLGAGRRMVSRSTARYRGMQRRAMRRKETKLTEIKQRAQIKAGDQVWVNWQKTGAFLSARVKHRRGNQVRVKYDDGEEESTTIAYVRRQKPRPTGLWGRFVSSLVGDSQSPVKSKESKSSAAER